MEHAKFPFPLPGELGSADTTDISDLEVVLLDRKWKANYAVRDDALVQKFCDSLKSILGETVLASDSENALLASFSPRLQSDVYGEDPEWSGNPSQVQVGFKRFQIFMQFGLTMGQGRSLLERGAYRAARECLSIYGRYLFGTAKINSVEGGSSKVDYVLLVDGDGKALCEAKSPSVVKKLGQSLPPRVIEFTWVRGRR